jgi:hypothetical protein
MVKGEVKKRVVKEEIQEIKQDVKASQPKQKKPRTQKQIEAFNKMRQALKEKKANISKADEPIETTQLQREETVEMEVKPAKTKTVKPIEERKENKIIEEEQEDNTFSNYDYDYSSIFSPAPTPASHVRVGNNTYSVQALKSYKNSLQHRKSHAPPSLVDKSIFY